METESRQLGHSLSRCFKAAFKCFCFFPLYLQIRRQIIRYDFGFIQAGKIFNAVFQLPDIAVRSEEHTSELQSRSNLVCRLLLEKKKKIKTTKK